MWILKRTPSYGRQFEKNFGIDAPLQVQHRRQASNPINSIGYANTATKVYYDSDRPPCDGW